MISPMTIQELLRERNQVLYTILKQRNQLQEMINQLHQEVNTHYGLILQEILTEQPIPENLTYLQKIQAKNNRALQAKEITMAWILKLKVMNPKFLSEFL